MRVGTHIALIVILWRPGRGADACVYIGKSVMRMGPVVFLPGGDGNRQTILFRSQWASCIGRNRAGRIVGSVEVDHHSPVHDGISFQETASWVGLGFAGQIIENEG